MSQKVKMITEVQTTVVVTLDDQRSGFQVPGIPCDECGNLADVQVDGMGSDRYWKCDRCGNVSREGLNMIGEPVYPGAAEIEWEDDELKDQTDIRDYQDDDESFDIEDVEFVFSDSDSHTDTTLDRWL